MANSNFRNTTLDLLRALAIIVIILHHAYVPQHLLRSNFSDQLYNILYSFMQLWRTGGWVAVDMFFVLSGFLVSGLLFNEYKKHESIDVKNFIIRRGFKIYPAFVFFIAATFVLEIGLSKAFNSVPHKPLTYLKDLLFLHNYLGGRWVHTWSLDVEEFFYLLIPLFLWVLVKRNSVKLNVILCAYFFLLIFGVVCRYKTVYNIPTYNFEDWYTKTHFRLDGLFFGVLISYIYNFKPYLLDYIYKYKLIWLLFSSAVVITNFLYERSYNPWIAIYLLGINPIGFGIFIVLALKYIPELKSKFILNIGQCSYAIYLWHVFFNWYCTSAYFKLLPRAVKFSNPTLSNLTYLLYLIIYIGASLFFGIFITKFLENPILKIRNRLYPAKADNLIIKTNSN